MKNVDQLNNELSAVIETGIYREKEIRQLVADGAEIGGRYLMDVIYSTNPVRDDQGNFCSEFPDTRIFELLVKLGADLKFEEEGFNCLFEACLGWNIALVTALLKLGANPNCVETTPPYRSLLSWLQDDIDFEKSEGTGGDKYLSEISEVLKRYGARYTEELKN